MMMDQIAFLHPEKAMWWIWFSEKHYLFCQGHGKVKAQPGFQTQTGLHQVEVLLIRGYLTF